MYKRQAQARQALENVKTVLGEMNLTMQDALKVSVFPVSYTHLDVYKRQTLS